MNIYDYYAQLRGFGDRRILHELFLFMMKFDKQEKNDH